MVLSIISSPFLLKFIFRQIRELIDPFKPGGFSFHKLLIFFFHFFLVFLQSTCSSLVFFRVFWRQLIVIFFKLIFIHVIIGIKFLKVSMLASNKLEQESLS